MLHRIVQLLSLSPIRNRSWRAPLFFHVLSHEVIIGLVDLIGPYYDLFEDSIIASRKLALTTLLSNDLGSLTDQVN